MPLGDLDEPAASGSLSAHPRPPGGTPKSSRRAHRPAPCRAPKHVRTDRAPEHPDARQIATQHRTAVRATPIASGSPRSLSHPALMLDAVPRRGRSSRRQVSKRRRSGGLGVSPSTAAVAPSPQREGLTPAPSNVHHAGPTSVRLCRDCAEVLPKHERWCPWHGRGFAAPVVEVNYGTMEP